MWEPYLDFEIRSPILPGDSPGQPELDEVGIMLGCEGLTIEDSELRFRLLLTYELTSSLFEAFQVASWAIVVTLECPETGQSAAFNLVDPFVRYGPLDGPNYKGSHEEDDGMCTDGAAVALELAVSLPGEALRPTLYVTASLQDIVSNTLAIDVYDKSVMSHERRESGAI
jgi:hypothetical protein